MSSSEDKISSSFGSFLPVTPSKTTIEKILVYLDQVSSNLHSSTLSLIQSICTESQKVQAILSSQKSHYSSLLSSAPQDPSTSASLSPSNAPSPSFPSHSNLITDPSSLQSQISSFFTLPLFSDIGLPQASTDCTSLIFSDMSSNIRKIDLESFEISRLDFFKDFIACGCQGCVLRPDYYFINGGIDEERQIHNNSYTVDLENSTYSTVTPSQGKRGIGACVAKDNKIYVFGGFSKT